MEIIRGELEELDDLERALIKQWGCVRRLASEDRETLKEPDNLVSALGLAVGDTLRSSKRFIREATIQTGYARLLHGPKRLRKSRRSTEGSTTPSAHKGTSAKPCPLGRRQYG
jgi:hypothetical protein